MNEKMTKTARMFNKGGAVGGPKPKGMVAGGKTKAKLPMVTDPKTGKEKPFFMVDGQGKKMGGPVEPQRPRATLRVAKSSNGY